MYILVKEETEINLSPNRQNYTTEHNVENYFYLIATIETDKKMKQPSYQHD